MKQPACCTDLFSGCLQLFDEVLSLVSREVARRHPLIRRPYPRTYDLLSQKLEGNINVEMYSLSNTPICNEKSLQ